ncbi:AAA family ATPase [Rhodococcus erythropolis]
MLFYSPHEDLQGRTFKAATKELQSTDRSVTPDTFFLWSPDPRLRTKLYDWSRPSSLAIPLLIDENEDLSLIRLLRDHIYTRDLFYVTTPVSGASFFGRRTLLQSMRDDVFNQRVTGVFGLRKSGKTSILTQLSEELKDDNVVTILMDLETFPCPPEDPTDDILADLRQRLLWELRSRGLRTHELEEIGQRPGILEVKNALQSVLKHLKEDGTRILLLLDEIEYLTPADKIDIAEGEMPRIAQMLSAFRSIVQESDNFTFTLSGLTSAIIESGRLYGRPNPLFSWARAVYVTPLDREEADDLASTVGGKMGIEITSGALEALHEASGGHAFLYRSLSSAVVSHLPVDDLKRTMSRSAVLTEISDWKSRIQGNIEEMIQHVKRYYPNESVMLEILMDSADDFKELAPEEHVAVRRLKDLGLIVETDGEFEVSVILELV